MDTKNVDGTVEGSTLSEAGLRNVTLRDVCFLGADLRGTDLSEVHLSEVNLRDVCLSGADLRGSDLTPEALLLVGAEFDETTTF